MLFSHVIYILSMWCIHNTQYCVLSPLKTRASILQHNKNKSHQNIIILNIIFELFFSFSLLYICRHMSYFHIMPFLMMKNISQNHRNSIRRDGWNAMKSVCNKISFKIFLDRKMIRHYSRNLSRNTGFLFNFRRKWFDFNF